ncbi:hypothetical protein HII31_01401 [Pseudocercospora fuligena]|uniref:Uncharacterized protein n=1 Tax=Pseudocercospora fuligena TaxID=685502 RepID=A0A8H6RU79_9PEZI|nr:hypothetical protein HII31_01401 [Pseudocercospora fuligena]
MPVISYLPTTKQYILTYEYYNSPAGGCPATFRLASDPTKFLSAAHQNLVTNSNYRPGGSPYSVWYQYPGSASGALVVSTNSDTNVFVSKDNVKTWTSLDIRQYTGQSRHLMLFNDKGATRLLVATAGFYGCSGDCYNYVANGVTDPKVFQQVVQTTWAKVCSTTEDLHIVNCDQAKDENDQCKHDVLRRVWSLSIHRPRYAANP